MTSRYLFEWATAVAHELGADAGVASTPHDYAVCIVFSYQAQRAWLHCSMRDGSEQIRIVNLHDGQARRMWRDDPQPVLAITSEVPPDVLAYSLRTVFLPTCDQVFAELQAHHRI